MDEDCVVGGYEEGNPLVGGIGGIGGYVNTGGCALVPLPPAVWIYGKGSSREIYMGEGLG